MMKSEKKLWRMWKVLSLALSIVVRVYWYRIRGKSQWEKEKLWERIGKEFKETLFELNGVLIKVGQLLSIREDLLPRGFINQVQDLVDHVPPSPWEEIEKVLEREWDSSVTTKVQAIDQEAVASASIGEVYKATLLDGKQAAIKVQRPEIPSLVKTDFRSLSIIIWFARRFAPVPKGFIDFKMLYQELKQVIEQELDFSKEMNTAVSFKQRFKDHPNVKIPAMYPELCTDKVLVMEWVDGVRLNDRKAFESYGLDGQKLAQELFRLFLPQWLEPGIFHADPHAGNILLQPDGTFVLLDYGMIGEISKRDSTHFQDLLEGILLKNFRKAAEALSQLGFLLPDASPKTIEPVLKEFVTLDMEQFKQMDLISVKKEINEMVKSLPVQVPTRFIFLGRSFATIEGLVHTLSPDEETLDVVKPAFMDWVKDSNTNKWELLLKWVSAQPLFQTVQKIRQLLDLPEKALEQKDHHQQNEFQFVVFENQKKQAFILLLFGGVGAFTGLGFDVDFLWQGSLVVSGLSLVGYLFISSRQKRWLKRLRNGQLN
ncbi:putative unusual protein kinase regulating ubiquinone biosynthesis (AarF/ABC1/UbiB family) [Rossellomorea aquimaris]|uniref:Putative unusual protein kinase regulating ubiquinone biosynthesis (AarF/ABC1/UbiB family) n=2 Tax=Rossellomorea aquimaris TaxID=189382 RepID=A0A366ELU4_9BACI|nr:putative unusual protein kinase regulating ubiquinone biosynthesis (AarF/ABC1/UbiB family) [Rossellomorea aquimaris]